MKKYQINVSIRKGLSDTPFRQFELDSIHFEEAFQVKDLGTFKDDAYLVFSLTELQEPEIAE